MAFSPSDFPPPPTLNQLPPSIQGSYNFPGAPCRFATVSIAAGANAMIWAPGVGNRIVIGAFVVSIYVDVAFVGGSPGSQAIWFGDPGQTALLRLGCLQTATDAVGTVLREGYSPNIEIGRASCRERV